MKRVFAPCAAIAALWTLGWLSYPVSGQGKADHPHLRAALHELREAKGSLAKAQDQWPPGYRDRAMHSIDDAMNSVRTILAVKDVNSFVGVDRNPDFYRNLGDHPHLRAALRDLRDARNELSSAKADFRGLKERAIDDIDVAVGDILTLIRYKKR
jgi:hypothetical protein